MNKNNILVAFMILVFMSLFTYACQTHKDKKIIIEQDSLRKIIEEQDSLRIFTADSILKK